MVGFSFKCSSNFWGKSLWNSSLVFGIPNRPFVALLQAQQALQPGETWACFLWNSPSLLHYPLQYLSAKGLWNTQLNSHWAPSNTHRLNEQPTRCPQWGMAGLLLMICKSLHRLILVEGTACLLDDVSQAKCCAKARVFFFHSNKGLFSHFLPLPLLQRALGIYHKIPNQMAPQPWSVWRVLRAYSHVGRQQQQKKKTRHETCLCNVASPPGPWTLELSRCWKTGSRATWGCSPVARGIRWQSRGDEAGWCPVNSGFILPESSGVLLAVSAGREGQRAAFWVRGMFWGRRPCGGRRRQCPARWRWQPRNRPRRGRRHPEPPDSSPGPAGPPTTTPGTPPSPRNVPGNYV